MTQTSTFNRGPAENLADKATDKVDQVFSRVEQTARSISDQGREASEQVGQVADNLKTAIDKSAKEQPMATLAVAIAAGFVLGALWKS